MSERTERERPEYGWRPIAELKGRNRVGRRIIALVDGEPTVCIYGKASHVPWYGWGVVGQDVEDFDLCEPTHFLVCPPPNDPKLIQSEGPAGAATAAPELDRCADGDGDVSRDAPIRPRVGGSSRGEDDPRAASSAPAPERRSGKDRRVENGGWASRPSRSGIDRRASQQAKDGAEVPEVNNGLGDPDRPLGAPDASDVDLAGSPDTSVKEASPANGDAGSVARSQTLEPRGGRYGWENRMGPPPKRAALDRPRVEEPFAWLIERDGLNPLVVLSKNEAEWLSLERDGAPFFPLYRSPQEREEGVGG